MNSFAILVPATVYICILFYIAQLGDKAYLKKKPWVSSGYIYALALGVYCTSWTFYGLVDTATTSGWSFLPILLGPILLFIFGLPLLERIHELTKKQHAHSLADFIASRYGKRQGVAATITCILLIVTVPYIALQLKAVSDSLNLATVNTAPLTTDTALLVTAAMAGFALLFGTRQLEVSNYHAGMMVAIAFESIIKIAAFIAVGCLAIYLLWDVDFKSLTALSETNDNHRSYNPFSSASFDFRFAVETIISACAIFCLPRQFHVTFVENLSLKNLHTARKVFTSYLVLICLFVIPIAFGGNILLGDSAVSTGSYVLQLPKYADMNWLVTIAFIGGFSAATAMIIVATITVSQMLSNDVILPLLIRHRYKQGHPAKNFTTALLFIRRGTVIGILIFAYLYQEILAENAALTSIGLIAFALAVQLAPAILIGIYWNNGHANGVYAGLICGGSLWFYTLMVPVLVNSGMISPALLTDGPLGISWLRPEHLFGFEFGDSFSRGVTISLVTNIIAFIAFSRYAEHSLADRIQAQSFYQASFSRTPIRPNQITFSTSDLRELLEQFLGKSQTYRVLEHHNTEIDSNIPSDELLSDAEKSLAGIVGVASARAMIDSLSSGRNLGLEEVVSIFDQTTKALSFNQDLINASFANISSGISVIDRDLRLVAWNQRYSKMFDYPEHLLKVGTPVADLVRFNAQRGLCGPGAVEDHVRKRTEFMHKGSPYRYLRSYADGTVIEIRGNPLPHGGFVTTFDDITEFIHTQKLLEDANNQLEKRVEERTQIISRINEELMEEINRRSKIEEDLQAAKAEAEAANATKTRFLALASHDILQPLNAAHLYASALQESKSLDQHDTELVQNVYDSLLSAEEMMNTLLEISRLDSGAMEPNIESLPIDGLLRPLIQEFSIQASEAVEIHYVPSSVWIKSDAIYLRRILQNFLSNAVKYTAAGKILIGCRRRKDSIDICIYDTGPGISDFDQKQIFEDFYRASSQKNVPGIGLGLAVAQRFIRLLGHKLSLNSKRGRGSCFTLQVPLGEIVKAAESSEKTVTIDSELNGLRILCVDDDAQNLAAISSLLHRWHCESICINNNDEARDYARNNSAPDALLMDFQLDDGHNGIKLAQTMCDSWQHQVPVAIISATPDKNLPYKAAEQGFEYLKKPVKPAKLKALLRQVSLRKEKLKKP